MQNSPSPKLNDGLTSKAKHEVFEGVLSALAKKFYKPELLENGWHEHPRLTLMGGCSMFSDGECR